MSTGLPKVINDFHALFMLVCWRNSGPIMVDTGKQKSWEGVTAGKCSSTVQFLQTEGINAFLDTRDHTVLFSKGSPEMLESTLGMALQKSRASTSLAA